MGREVIKKLSDIELMAILGSDADREDKAQALEELRERHEGTLLSYAKATLRDRSSHGLEAEDVVQEVFALLLITAKATKFDAEKSPLLAPWLRAVVRNQARDLLRRTKIHLNLNNDSELPLCSNQTQPADRRLEVEELLATLTPEDRQLCEQFYLHRYSAEEIAVEAGSDSARVYRDLHRIRKQLRERFALS